MDPELKSNPAWALYCQSEGRGGESQLAHDEWKFPDNKMTAFILWNQERLAEFGKTHPDALIDGTLVDPTSYEAWLLRWVNSKSGAEIDAKLRELGVEQ